MAVGRSIRRRARPQVRPLPPDVVDLDDDDLDRRPIRLPALRATMRLAASDLYFNSWRMAPANLVWGALLVFALVAGPMSLLGMVLLIALSVPTAGLHRMGALIARGRPAGFSDFIDGMRRFAIPALLAGTGAVATAVVLTTNVIVGLETNSPVGWFMSALALWGLVGLAMLLVAFWPILADPERDGLSIRRRLALAGIAVIGRPRRMVAVTGVVGIVFIVSTVLFAMLVIVGVAYVSVLTSRYVLPTVDELESRLIR